jgi:hypothetical protein
MASSLWKEHKNGTFYANWDRLGQQEPATIALLRKEPFARAETDEFSYYVNYHEEYGWSVGRTSKNNQQQPQKISEQQRQQEQPQQEQLLQQLLQQCTTMTSSMQEQEQKNDEILRTLNRLESKIDENYHLHNNEQAQESNEGIMEDGGK